MLIRRVRVGVRGWLVVDIRGGREGGGVMQKRESPDFTFPEVGIFANTSCTQCIC